MEDNTLDFNFWPSFSDLMLTLVLILVIVVFAVITAFSVGKNDELKPEEGRVIPPEVEQKQMVMIQGIAAAYRVKPIPRTNEPDSYEIRIRTGVNRYTRITIKNEPTLQRYSFSDRILFEPNKFNLKQNGKDTLRTVGCQINRNLNSIREIQIQGHADPTPPDFETSNLHLAAKRAISVFRFLQFQIPIDPAKHLMSATSFGEYKPIQRSDQDSTYTPEQLRRHNRTRDMRDKNRRIEILLFYRNEKKDE